MRPRVEQLLAEAWRLRVLRGFEEQLALAGYQRVAGVDEVGRGSLAGPVVAAAVIPDATRAIPGVDDSKAVPAEHRGRIADAIRRTSLASAWCAVPAGMVDRVNVLEATRQAMTAALRELTPAPDLALVDAVRLDGAAFPCVPIVRGDAVSYAVACASILAKVERDRLMGELHEVYPHYGFATHKGYGSPEHLRSLSEFGPSPVHRLTFRGVVPRSGEAVH